MPPLPARDLSGVRSAPDGHVPGPDRADLRAPLRASADDAPLREAIAAAIARKPKGHDFDYSRGVAGQMSRHMSHTGG